MHEQYSTNPSDGRFCVYNIIETYTAYVAEHDRNRRYDRFKQPGSDIRIIFATTSLGMGINVPDVARVCLWNFPIGKDLGDFWQRVGRGGRGKDMKSTAYIFLPYWAFDSEGKSKESTRNDTIKASTPTPISSRRGRNRLPSRRKKGGAVGPSRLNQALTPGDCSDVDEET
ncbi:hypothetical protein EG328_002905 [Venturia inaequalis]|uniref:DNA 3'-5' helicase n=1 Tax=Venturia inaequalis TaxID=5025 RepID=A0A8H3U1G3_VENIN|nr:hypothetical protein EG328_002905 [Venturia inaequalis]